MGLPVSILARDRPDDDAVARVYAELRAVDARFSPYLESSEVSRINRGELSLDDAHEDVREVFARCAAAREVTAGLFDATTPAGLWDPSGLVKGWAAERSVRHLGEGDWCLNAGGDVVVLTPSGEPFTVGIQDPRDDGQVIHALTTTSCGVATSGVAARGAHLYDPRTGQPVTGPWLSVTVTGPSLETADVLATASFVAGEAVLLPDYRAISVDSQGTLSEHAGTSSTLEE